MTLDFLEDMDQNSLLSVIKRASIKLTSEGTSKIEIVKKQNVLTISKNLTNVHIQFNRMLAFNNNIINIKKSIAEDTLRAIKQQHSEKVQSNSGIGKIDLPDLGPTIDKLTKSLEDLDFSNDQQGGLLSSAADIVGGRRRGGMLRTGLKVAGAAAATYGTYKIAEAVIPSMMGSSETKDIPRASSANAQTKKSNVHQTKLTNKATAALDKPVPERKQSPVAQNSFSSRFADYMKDTFKSVTSYVSSIPERLASLGTSAWQDIQDGAANALDYVTDVALPAVGIGDGWIMNMIRGHEGTVNKVYKDSVGKLTFGVGHLITKGDPEYGKPVGTPVSEKRVQEVFTRDYAKHKKIAERTPGWDKANASQRGAMVDLAFNMGEWWRKWPTTSAALEKGDWKGAASGLRQSKWYGQVGKRAKTIIGLISTGNSSAERIAGVGQSISRAGGQAVSAAGDAVSTAGSFITGAFGKMKDLVGSVFTLNGGITGNKKNLMNWHPKFETAVAGAVTEYNRLTGIKPVMTSGFRYPGDQAKISGKGGMKAAPGKSRHEKGQAVDFNSADVTRMKRMGILDKYGLDQPFPRDDVHIQMKGGPLASAKIDPKYASGEDSPKPEPKVAAKAPAASQANAIAKRSTSQRRTTRGGTQSSASGPRVAIGGKGKGKSKGYSLRDAGSEYLAYLGAA